MLSNTLVQLMEEKRISQSELASILNTHRQNVYQWVSGKTVPRNEMLKKLASYFNVSIDYLLGNQSTSSNTASAKAEISTSNKKQTRNKKPDKSLNLKEIFSDNLKFYRKQAGLTQDDFAKSVKTDPVYISYIENGKRFPSIEYIEKMAKILGIESYKLFLPAHTNENELSNQIIYNKIKENVLKAIDMVFEN